MKRISFNYVGMIFLVFAVIFNVSDVFALTSSDVPYGATVYINGIHGDTTLYTDQSCDSSHHVSDEGIYCLMASLRSPTSTISFIKGSFDSKRDSSGNYVFTKNKDYIFTPIQKYKVLAILLDPALRDVNLYTKQRLIWYALGQRDISLFSTSEAGAVEALNNLSDEYLSKTYYKYDLNYYYTDVDEKQDVIGSTPIPYSFISFEKVDESGKDLAGVEFSVYELVGDVPKNKNGIIDSAAASKKIADGSVTLKPTKIHIEKEVGSNKYEYVGEKSSWVMDGAKLALYFIYSNGNYMIRETKGVDGYASGVDDIFLSINNKTILSSYANGIHLVNKKIYVGFQKTDENKHAVSGATLKLQKITLNDSGKIQIDTDGNMKLSNVTADWVTSSDNAIHFVGLSSGLYVWKEVKAPSGYEKASPIYFYIQQNGVVSSAIVSKKNQNVTYEIGNKLGDGTNYSLAEKKADALITMVNRKIPDVVENIPESPKTGSIAMFVFFVIIIVSISIIITVTSLKRNSHSIK